MIKKEYIDLLNNQQSSTVEIELVDGSSETYHMLQTAVSNLFQKADTVSKELQVKEKMKRILQQLALDLEIVLEHIASSQLPQDIRSRLAKIAKNRQSLQEALNYLIAPELSLKRQDETIKSIQAVVDCFAKFKEQREKTRSKLFEKNKQRLSKNHQIRAKLRKGLENSIQYCDRRLRDFRQQLKEQKQKAKELKRRYQLTKINSAKHIQVGDRSQERGSQQEDRNNELVSLRGIDVNGLMHDIQTTQEEISTDQTLRLTSTDSQQYMETLLIRQESGEYNT